MIYIYILPNVLEYTYHTVGWIHLDTKYHTNPTTQQYDIWSLVGLPPMVSPSGSVNGRLTLQMIVLPIFVPLVKEHSFIENHQLLSHLSKEV